MSARISHFIRIARLSARRNIEADPERAKNRVLTAILGKKDKEKKLTAYTYKSGDHAKLDNKHIAWHSKGCGCELCAKRFEYVRLKRERKTFQQSYESQFYKEAFNKCLLREGRGMTDKAFFNLKMAKYSVQINELKARIKTLESYIQEFESNAAAAN